MSEVAGTETVTDEPAFPATLDLSSADTRGNFMESGWKDAVVTEVTGVKTENPDGNLPLGTPGINVKFTIDGGEYDNRNVWNRYWFPPAEYDEKKRNRTLGMFVRFLGALGFDEADIKANGFNMDNIDDIVGRECKVNTRYDEDYDNNKVTGVRARNAAGGTEGSTAAGVL